MDNQLPSELQHAFEEAIAKYNRWQSGDEPTVSYQMQDRSISSICNLMTFYENVPLRPAIMALLIVVADDMLILKTTWKTTTRAPVNTCCA